MCHQVLGDLLQSVVTSNQVVFSGKLLFQLLLLLLVEFSLLDQVLQVVLEILICQLQFGNAVLVKEGNGRPVLDGLAEVVDADVIAEDFLRLLLPGHQWRAGEADEGGFGQGISHVEGQRVVLAAVGLVGHHDDVGPVRQLRVPLALLRSEFLDQREDESVVFCEQLLQVFATVSLTFFGHGPGVAEVLVNLVVEIVSVGDDEERPIARHFAQAPSG